MRVILEEVFADTSEVPDVHQALPASQARYPCPAASAAAMARALRMEIGIMPR